MLLFVGLGNPGAKYSNNRHNLGFMAVERIAGDHGFTPWKSKFQADICEGRLGGAKTLLLKPMTYMNNSGQAVGEAMRFFRLAPEDVTVFHDEIDLAPGKIRVKQGGGHAGNNGLRSLHQHIGDQYQRVRMGIGHPGRKDLVSHYVLQDFSKTDRDWLDDLLRGVSEGVPFLADGKNDRFLNAVAQRIAPSRPPKPASQATAATSKKAEPQPAPDKPDTRSALQRLVDRFR